MQLTAGLRQSKHTGLPNGSIGGGLSWSPTAGAAQEKPLLILGGFGAGQSTFTVAAEVNRQRVSAQTASFVLETMKLERQEFGVIFKPFTSCECPHAA